MDGFSSTTLLLSSAFIIGVTHTLLGPDHYLPFVALGKARRWRLQRTLGITTLCGLGHVGASVLLGVIGAFAGWSLSSLTWLETMRGQLAAWLLVGFGLFYLIWAIRNFNSKRPHSHMHAHADGTLHDHPHTHHGGHVHPHTEGTQNIRTVTAWSLFIIFVFGPCEALVPLLLVPAIAENSGLAVAVVLVFALATVSTMVGLVWAMSKGVELVRFRAIGRYGHVAAGLVLLGCGTAIHLGL